MSWFGKLFYVGGSLLLLFAGLWLVVVGFLPTMLTSQGLSLAMAAHAGALVAISNIAGNLLAGVLLQRGVAARHVLMAGFVVLMLASMYFGRTDRAWLGIPMGVVAFLLAGAGTRLWGQVFRAETRDLK